MYTKSQLDAMIRHLQAARDQLDVETLEAEFVLEEGGLPFVFEDMGVPTPTVKEESTEKVENMEIPLPEGVESTEKWGSCIVTWGTAAQNCTFEDIWEGKTERTAGYRRWVLSQKAFSQSYLTDLQQYLRRRESETKAPCLLYPGSNKPRVFKNEPKQAASESSGSQEKKN